MTSDQNYDYIKVPSLLNQWNEYNWLPLPTYFASGKICNFGVWKKCLFNPYSDIYRLGTVDFSTSCYTLFDVQYKVLKYRRRRTSKFRCQNILTFFNALSTSNQLPARWVLARQSEYFCCVIHWILPHPFIIRTPLGIV